MTTTSRVLVTGANGFIGRAVMHRLRSDGVPAVGVDLIADPDLGVVAGSTLHPDAWASHLTGVDCVVHTAALVSGVAPLDAAWSTNVLATSRVLRASARAGVRRFVHLSSILAFGFEFPDGVTEDYPSRVCGDSYVDTKVNGEAVVLMAHAAGGIECTIIRPGDVYGPGSRPWVILPIRMIKAGQVVLPDRGKGVFSQVYVDDLVTGVLTAARHPAAAGQVYTMTDGAAVTCAEYFGALARIAGGRIRTAPGGLPVGPARVLGATLRALGRESELSAASMKMMRRRGTYSIAKARDQLGYEPAVMLGEGMERVGDWYRSPIA